LQNKTLFEPLHNNTKKGQNSTKKARNLLVHIVVELSTAVVKVDMKVTNASLTQTVCNAGLNARSNTSTARRHWTEKWRHDQVWRRLL